MADRVVAVVLAAGRASRFGSTKILAPLGGRPILAHVLDRISAAGIDEVVVVLGGEAATVEASIAWRSGTMRIVNPDPSRGLASSLVLGVTAARADADPDAILVALGDQPRLDPDVIGRLRAALDGRRPIVVPRYADDANPNPVLIGRAAFDLVALATGDRGLGPLIAQHRALLREIEVAGSNPDVDTPEDLGALEGASDPTAGSPLRHPVP